MTRPAAGGAAIDTRRAPVDGLITTAQDLVAQVDRARQQFHVIAPVVSTSQLAPGFAAALSVVSIDLTPGSPDFYTDRLMKPDEVALTKISLMRIANALGVSWTKTERLDNGSRPHYWNVRVEGEYRASDGSLQKLSASKEVDLSDGSPLFKTMTEKEVGRARLHGQQLAETKAKLRAVREFGVVAKYTRDQLKKPFLIVRFSFVPDMSDPDIKRLVTAAHMGLSGLLYGASGGSSADAATMTDALPAALGGSQAPEPRQVGAGRSVPAAEQGPRDFDEEDDRAADDRPRYRVERVLTQNADGDYAIILAGGRQLVTADETIARAANRAKRDGIAVVITATAEGRLEELIAVDGPAPSAVGGETAADDTADDGLRLIAKVEPTHGTSPDRNDPTKKRPWTRYTVIATTGESWSTFSKSHADIAQEAADKGWKVRISGEQSERYPDQTDLRDITLIDPRQQTLPVGERY